MIDIIGKSWPKMILVNGTGIIVLILVAYGVAWIKKSPWKQTKQVRVTGM
jgi:hypothetical protein